MHPNPQEDSTLKYLLLTLALSVFAIAPLSYPSYFQTHTGFTVLWDIAALKNTPFDLKWIPALTGFDLWRSGGLLPYHIAALLPFSPLNSMKIVLGASVLAGASGLFLWLKSWVGAKGATVAALAYTYAPFVIGTLFVRGAFSESVFWGLLPWALLAATYLVASPTLPVIAIALFFWTSLGLTQLGLTLWAWIMLVVMQVGFHRPQSVPPIISAGIGFLAAFGITKTLTGAAIPPTFPTPAEHLLYPAQLLSPVWGFGISVPGWQDGMSFSLGFAAIGLAILAIYIWQNKLDPRPWFFVGVAGVPIFLVLAWATWFWRVPAIGQTLTYPWQLLGFSALGLAVLGGVGFWLSEKMRTLPIFAAALILILLAAYPKLEPQFITIPIPPQAETIYADNQIALLDHRFEIKNPQKQIDDLHPIEPFLPMTEMPQAGDSFYLSVHWQAIHASAESYKIFGHLVDAAGNIITQIDVIPMDGARPTDTWIPGEIIADRYTFTLPADAPAPAQIWLGFYNPETSMRLSASNDDNGRSILNVE